MESCPHRKDDDYDFIISLLGTVGLVIGVNGWQYNSARYKHWFLLVPTSIYLTGDKTNPAI